MSLIGDANDVCQKLRSIKHPVLGEVGLSAGGDVGSRIESCSSESKNKLHQVRLHNLGVPPNFLRSRPPKMSAS